MISLRLNLLNPSSLAVSCRVINRRWASSAPSTVKTHYEVFELPHAASIREVKKQFKILSKKYHPDLNGHLDEAAKLANSDRFREIVDAYEVLKDKKRKREYDLTISQSRNDLHARRTQDWNNKYYGEAKNYLRSGLSYSGYSRTRHRVHNFTNMDNRSTFNGMHANYGDRDNVPHFNYREHLNKHLKFEQRMVCKSLTEAEISHIVRQLNKDGDASKVDPEVLTKHLMRHSKLKQQTHNVHSGYTSIAQDPQVYQGDTDTGMIRTMGVVGALGILAILWKSIG